MINNRFKKGFTLIELMVVIALIAILSSVLLVSLSSSRAKGRDAKRIADIDALKTALALYADSHSSRYPDTLAVLADPTVRLLPAPPVAPNNGEFYSYVRSNDGLSYHLGATLEASDPVGSVLGRDKDCNSGVIGSCPGFSVVPNYPGMVGAGVGPFDGADSKACNGAAAGRCYDVTP